MRVFISSGLAAAALGAALTVAGALPASAQVARPQSALAHGDNSNLLTLVQDRTRVRAARGSNMRVAQDRTRLRAARGSNIRVARAHRGDPSRWRNRNHWNNNWRWRHRHAYWGHRYGYWGRGYGYWGSGVAVGIGLGAPYYAYQPRYYVGDDAVAYCMSRFRSYDPVSGTYLGYDGLRHPCP